MDINKKIRKASVAELISWWLGQDLPKWANTTALFSDKVAFGIARKGPDGIRFLKTQADSKDNRRRSLVLRALANKKTYDDEVISFLIDAFRINPGYESGVAEGFKVISLDCFIQIGEYPFDRGEIEPLLEHEEKYLSATAMVYLSHAFPQETVQILRAGLTSANEMKRGYACTQAGFRNIKALKDEVRELREDANWYVFTSAQIACEMFDIVWSAR